NEMVKLLLSDFSTVIETKNLEIVYKNILIDKKLDIFANEQLIYTCLRNILDNAIRYSEVNHLIHIKLDDDSDYINLTIENQGAGLDTEVLEGLGERFFRVLGTKTQGSGLGLSICKKIIELHRGRITFAQSSIGGLKVQIQLPKTI
ncbi:sensor histidine kinase, partial [Acinetobacter junii]